MVSYASTVSISRTADQIYPHLLDTTLRAVNPGVLAKQPILGELQNGARLKVTYGVGPVKAVVGLQIMAVDYGKRLAFQSYSGPLAWDGEYKLADDGHGSTTVSQQGNVTVKGRWRLLPFAGGEIKRSEIRELRRLKQAMESSPAV